MTNIESIIYFMIPEIIAVLLVIIGHLMIKNPPGKPIPILDIVHQVLVNLKIAGTTDKKYAEKCS